MEALDAAAVEAALSLCEEAVSEGHTLPGPWETQDLKASDPSPIVQDPDPTPELQDEPELSTPIPTSIETQNQPETKTEEHFRGDCEETEVTGSDVTPSVAPDDCATGSEVTEDGVTGKEVTEAVVKSEGEEWSQPETNPPCLGEYVTQTQRESAVCFLTLLCLSVRLRGQLRIWEGVQGSSYKHSSTPSAL